MIKYIRISSRSSFGFDYINIHGRQPQFTARSFSYHFIIPIILYTPMYCVPLWNTERNKPGAKRLREIHTHSRHWAGPAIRASAADFEFRFRPSANARQKRRNACEIYRKTPNVTPKIASCIEKRSESSISRECEERGWRSSWRLRVVSKEIPGEEAGQWTTAAAGKTAETEAAPDAELAWTHWSVRSASWVTVSSLNIGIPSIRSSVPGMFQTTPFVRAWYACPNRLCRSDKLVYIYIAIVSEVLSSSYFAYMPPATPTYTVCIPYDAILR